jgi:hypothetical protein
MRRVRASWRESARIAGLAAHHLGDLRERRGRVGPEERACGGLAILAVDRRVEVRLHGGDEVGRREVERSAPHERERVGEHGRIDAAPVAHRDAQALVGVDDRQRHCVVAVGNEAEGQLAHRLTPRRARLADEARVGHRRKGPRVGGAMDAQDALSGVGGLLAVEDPVAEESVEKNGGACIGDGRTRRATARREEDRCTGDRGEDVRSAHGARL